MEEYLTVIKKYAEFSGRSTRREYWMFFVVSLGISIVLSILEVVLSFDYLSDIYSLAIFLPSLGVAIRRMHDINESGWFCIIPFYNLYLAAQPGTKGSNKYGADPSGSDSDHPVNPEANSTPAPTA